MCCRSGCAAAAVCKNRNLFSKFGVFPLRKRAASLPCRGLLAHGLHHMVASLPHMGGTAPDSSEHLPVLFELLNKVYSAVNVCTERGVSERGDLSPCEPWVLVNHVIN